MRAASRDDSPTGLRAGDEAQSLRRRTMGFDELSYIASFFDSLGGDDGRFWIDAGFERVDSVNNVVQIKSRLESRKSWPAAPGSSNEEEVADDRATAPRSAAAVRS